MTIRSLTILLLVQLAVFGCDGQDNLLSTRKSRSDLSGIPTDRYTSNNPGQGFQLAWDSYGDSETYKLVVSDTAFCETVISERVVDTTEVTLSVPDEGRYFVCIYAQIENQDIQINRRAIELLLDLTPPQLGGAFHYITKEMVIPELSTDDLTQVDVTWLQPSDVYISDNYVLKPQISAQTDGDYRLTLILVDEAGNRSEATIFLVWDSTLPDNFSSQRIPSPTNIDIVSENKEINLTWNEGGAADIGYLLVRSSDVSFNFIPTNGLLYGTKDLDNYSLINVDSRTELRDYVSSNDSIYYYKLYAYDSYYRYSDPLIFEAQGDSLNYEYIHYRLQILSSQASCDDLGMTEVRNLEFYFNNSWHINDFNHLILGKVGEESAIVQSSAIDFSEFSPFYAFTSTSEAWASRAGSIGLEAPYDVLEPTYLQVSFRDGPIKIEGMRILGGEPGFEDCSPDSFILQGSDNEEVWIDIPGSLQVEQDISTSRKSYFFSEQKNPLTPSDGVIITHETTASIRWNHSGGPENEFLLVRGNAPISFKPVNGQIYAVGTVGADQIISIGPNTSFNDSGLLLDTNYFYAVFSKTVDNKYSSALFMSKQTKEPISYSSYRFVVDSIRGDNFETSTQLESLRFQVNGIWDNDYNFGMATGDIGGVSASISESSTLAVGSEGFKAFTMNQFWNSNDQVYSDSIFPFNAVGEPEYIQIDFPSAVAITGYSVFNSGQSNESFYRSPDAFHLEGSNDDGNTWTVIEGSQGAGNIVEPVVREW